MDKEQLNAARFILSIVVSALVVVGCINAYQKIELTDNANIIGAFVSLCLLSACLVVQTAVYASKKEERKAIISASLTAMGFIGLWFAGGLL